MYDSENWVWRKKNEIRINAVEMRPLRSTCGVSRKDSCRNSDVRKRFGFKEDVVTRVERAASDVTKGGRLSFTLKSADQNFTFTSRRRDVNNERLSEVSRAPV
ncbi:hypothetical protein EVAR_41732_1 [Eumeta japonica]|uniref:Uncharacterized protein n=1 Tax=Eumeta variegata TaxID=151549 RepID=A0A4C1XI59_EUMVA|nr:hypothetical protein EVAR_41732_1 [Eumeta japonica]